MSVFSTIRNLFVAPPKLRELPPIDVAGVKIELVALCNDCGRFHRIETGPAGFATRMSEWEVKHRGHQIEFITPRRKIPKGFDDRRYEQRGEAPWWLNYKENADIKTAYGSSAALTCTLASLATSSTLVAGRESTAVSNTSNLYLDYALACLITVGTTPTTNTLIQVWLYGSRNDTPAYPDLGAATTLTGSDAGATFATAEVRNSALNFWGDALQVGTTSNRVYTLKPRGIAAAFDYILPKNWGVWVTHSTGVNLNSTGGNHVLSYTGIYATG